MSARPPRPWPWILVPIVGPVAVAAVAVVGLLTVGATRPWPWWGFFPWFPFVGIGIALTLFVLFGLVHGFAGPWGWGDGYDRAYRDDSRAILRERYARGEITADQFERMRRDLDEHLTNNAYEGEAARRMSP